MPESEISATTANATWLESLHNVYYNGINHAPRGLATKEIMNNILTFDMRYPICYHQDRKLSYKFMAAEAYWITSGSMFEEDIAPYNKFIGNFSDDGYIFNGNYGVPFIHQLDYVVNALLKDQHTRQAALTIWRPSPPRTKDFPCTIALIFNIRDYKIHTTVLMRSSDNVLGIPYDFFNFTIMTLRVLTYLNENAKETFGKLITLGNLTLHAVSSHIYEDKYPIVEELMISSPDKYTQCVPSQAESDWKFVVNSLLACRDLTDTTNLWKIRP